MMIKRTLVAIAVFLCIMNGSLAFAKGTSENAYSLTFDDAAYSIKTASVNGKSFSYRAYENIVYVRYPVDTVYQCLNVFVPVEYYENKALGGYTASSAPIFFPNTVGGYMPGKPGVPGIGRDGSPDASLVALANGCVVVSPGARGRTTQDASGTYTGKAPACIVDLKSAVRYLRFNDKKMPGDAEKIISNGTSAGGALSALLGASGNSKDYEPYLKKLGAADERDDIFAASCYCPITNLENADMAYEWLFAGVNEYKRLQFSGMTDFNVQRTEVKGSLTPVEIVVSQKLKALFSGYINSLELAASDGSALTLDAAGNGTFKDYVQSFVIASAQKTLDAGTNLSSLSWIHVRDGKVTDIDFEKYIFYVGRMKIPSAFDGLALENGENGLFGTETLDARHFTAFGAENSSVADAAMAEGSLVKMMNAMNYIGVKGASSARYWRIRHGTVDKDTSLAVPVILATTLEAAGLNVDFALPWDRGHSGDYDLDELFTWIGNITR